jgi:hypothetical protein
MLKHSEDADYVKAYTDEKTAAMAEIGDALSPEQTIGRSTRSHQTIRNLAKQRWPTSAGD